MNDDGDRRRPSAIWYVQCNVHNPKHYDDNIFCIVFVPHCTEGGLPLDKYDDNDTNTCTRERETRARAKKI